MSTHNIFHFLQNNLRSFAILKIAVNPNSPNYNELRDLYKNHIASHNNSILNDPFPNSGFDLFVPESTEVADINAKMISMDVKCEMLNESGRSCGYFMFPRSSLSKTPLMLANHTGIIDSGYRGNLIGAFRNLTAPNGPYTVDKHVKLLQVCHPTLCPLYVTMVEETDFSETSRGEGGFGSTGL